MKVGVIFHRFGPYHCARLEAASRRCAVVGIELGAETREYGWSKVEGTHAFEWVTLFPESDSRLSQVGELEKRVREALSVCQPDAVALPGWSDKGALAALRWCIDNGVPAVLMSESMAIDESRVWWKEFAKRRIIALCSAALVGGQRHKDYLTELGMPRDHVFIGYDVVDNDYFAQGAKEVESRKEKVEWSRREPSDMDEARRVRERARANQSGLPENYFLASARFIPKKNLDVLIRAYAEYRQRPAGGGQRSEVWSLVLLGDGPLKSDLTTLISDLGLQDSVLLPGFKQYDELPIYYGLANAFVHASSTEQWGLVVNEALASGLPVVVSDRCGCSPELVRDGINGFTFDPDNQSQLASRLLEMSSLPTQERKRMGKAGQEIAGQFGPQKFGEGLEQAARKAMDRLPTSRSLFDRVLLAAVLRF